MDESNLCVGVAYDFGEYPKIVAVHSGINQDSHIAKKTPKESKTSNSPSHKEFELRSGLERSNFGAHSTERLQHPTDLEYPGCHEFLGCQNEPMLHGILRNRFAMPDSFRDATRQPTVRYQNRRFVDASVLPTDLQQFQHSRTQQNNCVHPTNVVESRQFRHIGYSTNRFQAPPGYIMYPPRPEVNVISHNYLSPLDANHALSQRLSLNVRNHLPTKWTNRGSFQFASTSSTYPTQQNYVNNSRKRNFYQSNCGNMMFPRSDIVRLGIPVVDDRTGIMRFHQELHTPPRYPYFYRPTCNEIVGAAVLSARRYATNNERLTNDKACENEPSVAKNDVGYPQKTCPLNVPEQWMSREFFQCLLLHENKFELLQILKEAASSSRELLLYVVHRLLAKRLHATSLIVLDSLKRSDLPDIVKEKVLSVFQEILWRRTPRFDLWTMGNRQGSTAKGVVASAKNKEDLNESSCESGISHDHLDTAKKVANSMPCFESITDQTNISGIDTGRTSMHKGIFQNSPANCCDWDLDSIGKGPKDKEESKEDCRILHDHLGTAKEDAKSSPCIQDITDQADIAGNDHGRASFHEDVLQKSSSNCCDRDLAGTGEDPDDREESEEDHCHNEILHDHLGTAKDNARSMVSFEGITDQTDIVGFDSRRALYKDVLQKSPANCCGMNLNCIGKDSEDKEESEDLSESRILHAHLDTAKGNASSLSCIEGITDQTDIAVIDSGRASLHEDLLQKSPTKCGDKDLDGIGKDLVDRDQSEEDQCDSKILHDHLDTEKEDDTTDQIDIAGIDNEQTSVYKDVLQKSPTHCCDRDFDDIGKKRLDSHGTINTVVKKEERNSSVEMDFDDLDRESHENHGTFGTVIKKEGNKNSVHISSCCETEKIYCENTLESLQKCRKFPKESTEGEVANISSTRNHVKQDCFQTRDQCIQVEDIENFTVNVSPSRDSVGETSETDQAAFDEDSYAGFFSFDKLTDLENSNLEILGNISITMDSQGNTIINKEFSDEINFEDEITIKGFKILREWTEPIGNDVSLLTVTDRPCYANTQS